MVKVLLLAGSCLVAGTVSAAAQNVAQVPSSLRQPAVTLSFGGGMLVPVNQHVALADGKEHVPFYSGVPLVTAAIRVPLGSAVFVEAEGSHASVTGDYRLHRGINLTRWPDPVAFRGDELVEADESRAALTTRAGIGYRLGAPGISHFVSAGVGARRTSGTLNVQTTCRPLQPGGCEGTSAGTVRTHGTRLTPTAQIEWGMDIKVTRRLAAHAGGRWAAIGETTYDDGKKSGFGVTSGMRLAITRGDVLPSAAAVSKPHPIRTMSLAGVVAGSFVGTVLAHGATHDDVRIAAPAGTMLWGLGVGAAIGAIAHPRIR